MPRAGRAAGRSGASTSGRAWTIARVEAYELAERTGDAEVRRARAGAPGGPASARRPLDEAAAPPGSGMLDLVPRGRRTLTPLERRAVEALAIHHEHRAKDLDRARRYAEALERGRRAGGRRPRARGGCGAWSGRSSGRLHRLAASRTMPAPDEVQGRIPASQGVPRR